VSRDRNILLLNFLVLHNCIMSLSYCVIYGELWLQLVEMCCLSEPGYHHYLEGVMHKYGTIMRVWVGPHLFVALTEPKYVEVSKLALALWTKQKRQSYIELHCNRSVALRFKMQLLPRDVRLG
jgi:hypothetical protein